MARRALFATEDQPVKKLEEEDVGGEGNLEDGENFGDGSVGKKAIPAARKRPPVVKQTPEQRRAALGIEEELLRALENRDDKEAIAKWLREQAVCCGELTLQRLTQAGLMNGGEAQSILESYGYYVEDVKGGGGILDILAFHVWVKLDTKDERAEREIRKLTAQLTPLVPTGVTHCGVTRLADTSLELFEKFPLAEEVCSTLMCPVVQAHERDFVSVASVNPVTAATVGVLLEHIMKREGVRPFTFVITMDAGDWSSLCEKQFGIEV